MKQPSSEKSVIELHDNYLFFSSSELIAYFVNNLADKDIKTQTKRIFEMTRVYMAKKDFQMDDVYSILVMLRNIEDRTVVSEVIRLYFKDGKYPIRVLVQLSDLESTADIEIEFSVFRGDKRYVQLTKPLEPFSDGVVIDNYVHCSGVLPTLSSSGKVVGADYSQQVRQCLEHLKHIVETAGTRLQQAYAFVVYLKDLENLPLVEQVFAEYGLMDREIALEAIKVDALSEGHDLKISCSAYL